MPSQPNRKPLVLRGRVIPQRTKTDEKRAKITARIQFYDTEYHHRLSMQDYKGAEHFYEKKLAAICEREELDGGK